MEQNRDTGSSEPEQTDLSFNAAVEPPERPPSLSKESEEASSRHELTIKSLHESLRAHETTLQELDKNAERANTERAEIAGLQRRCMKAIYLAILLLLTPEVISALYSFTIKALKAGAP
jgi:hypothetical protein